MYPFYPKVNLDRIENDPTVVSMVNVDDKPLSAMLYNGLDSGGFTTGNTVISLN